METTVRKEAIKTYIKDMLNYLDGRGLVLTDDDLIEEALDDFGDFNVLFDIAQTED